MKRTCYTCEYFTIKKITGKNKKGFLIEGKKYYCGKEHILKDDFNAKKCQDYEKTVSEYANTD